MDLAKLAVGKLLKFNGPVFKQIGAGNLSFDIGDAVFRVAVVDVQADWPGWPLASCQRYWKHALYPCPCCNITDFSDLNAITSAGGPWTNYTHDDWLKDVASHKKVFADRIFLIISVVAVLNFIVAAVAAVA